MTFCLHRGGELDIHEAARFYWHQGGPKQVKLDELRRKVRRGIDSDPSEKWDAKAVKAKALARRAAKPAASMGHVTRRPQASDLPPSPTLRPVQ